jgi:pimeloyl-ACP methyl ester carboxylesterase
MTSRRSLMTGLLVAVSVLLASNKGETAAPLRPRVHLYVLLGFANNSPGLSEFGSRMESQGIPTTVASYSDASSLAQQAVELYKGGALRSILIVGHSYGGRAAAEMASLLGESGVPVRLMVTFDPTGGVRVPRNVRRAVNFVPIGREDHYSVIAAHLRAVTGYVLREARS